MASTEGFLTEEQRETLKIATQNAEVLSSSPKSPTSLLSEHYLKVPAGGKAPNVGIAVRHVRRSHSGKLVRVKKGEFSTYMQFFYMVISYLGFRRLIKFLSIFDHFLCFYQTFYIFGLFFFLAPYFWNELRLLFVCYYLSDLSLQYTLSLPLPK